MISARLPYPPSWGFARRVFHLATELAKSQQVSVLAMADEGDTAEAGDTLAAGLAALDLVTIEPYKALTKRVAQLASLASTTPYHVRQTRQAALQHRLDEILAMRDFDLIQVESSQLAWLRIPPGIPLVVDEHNIESEVLRRMAVAESTPLRRAYNWREAKRYETYERHVWERADGIAITSKRDAQAVSKQAPEALVGVVPNGVDCSEFRPSGRPAQHGSIVFVGLLDYRPNLDGIRWFLTDIFPLIRRSRPDAQLTIVGDGPRAVLESLAGPGVVVTGKVPDVVPILDRAEVAVVPLRIGGGTRLKVVEAMAVSTPIVTTSLGCEGIDVSDGAHVEIRDEPHRFAEAVIRLLGEPQYAQQLGESARALAIREYSWEASASRLASLHHEVIGRVASAS